VVESDVVRMRLVALVDQSSDGVDARRELSFLVRRELAPRRGMAPRHDERVAEGDRIDVPQRDRQRRRPRDATAVNAAERACTRRIDAVDRSVFTHAPSLRSAPARVTFDCDPFGTSAISASVDLRVRLLAAIDRYLRPAG